MTNEPIAYARRPRYITVFADASFCHETGAAGIAWWVRDADRIERSAKALTFACNNSHEAEVVALGTAILMALREFPHEPGDRLSIQSDCMGALAVFTEGRRMSDVEAAMKHRVWTAASAAGVTLHPKHVKGHSGGGTARGSVNTWCDRNARRVMREARAKMVKAAEDQMSESQQ